MILATFNVENLFQRAAAFNEDLQTSLIVLADLKRLNELIDSAVYTQAIKDELIAIMDKQHNGQPLYPGLKTQGDSPFIRLRESRGDRLMIKRDNQPWAVRVNGRAGWVGWFELEREPIAEAATLNTARIIKLLRADVLAIVEAEDRPGLCRFNNETLPQVDAPPFAQAMLIDGNDERGIDVGVLTKKDFTIGNVRSHVDDTDNDGVVFSRDCAEFEITTKNGNKLLVMVNHLKSKAGGGASADKKRKRQAKRVREIYEQRRADGWQFIAILGDFNDLPDSDPLSPLLVGSGLVDVMAHPNFVLDLPGRPGTHGNCTASGKLDYILMSPELSAKWVNGGVERRGIWAGVNGDIFPHIPEITTATEVASDHAALWVELDI